MSGRLVVSIDFELMWGVRDHRSVAEYGDAILGGRTAIPEILTLFSEFDIHATWATVGLLFAHSRREMLDFSPDRRPAYKNQRLSPFEVIESSQIGENEKDDPLHFGMSLVQKIADESAQEIATHTYSHFYALEQGPDIADFSSDIASAKAIANERGIDVTSLVFPRNQCSSLHLGEAKQLGIDAFRGEPKEWLYRPRPKSDLSLLLRAMRIADAAIPVRPPQLGSVKFEDGTINVPASRFLRPWSRKYRLYNELHKRRVIGEIEAAARTGGTYHLWWHPHNFGRNTRENLSRLREILVHYRHCRDTLGMRSLSMREAALEHTGH